MEIIRFKFTRGKELRLISHLDQQRMFQRAFRRAKIHMCYSNGFNPHPKLSFSQAMPLGLISYAEYGDVCIENKIDLLDFTKQINEALPKGIHIIEAEYINPSALSLSASLCSVDYALSIPIGNITNVQILKVQIQDFLAQDEILIKKKSKKNKIKNLNIRPFILSIEVEAEACSDTILFKLHLNYIDQQCIKPLIILNCFFNYISLDFLCNESITVYRTDLKLL